ncbi:unnamed protein product [Auanema sp. JU1783]|nr:unnamed protein product [Auanema sp. JU1783]
MPFRQKRIDTFNIPDAISSMRGILHEIDFMVYEGQAWLDFYNVLKKVYENDAVKRVERLCFVIIAMERAILLVCERKTNSIFVFDSHAHERGTSGAFISATKFSNLLQFSMHLFSLFFPDVVTRGQSQKFEISCIQLNNSDKITEKIFPRKFGILKQKVASQKPKNF